MCCYRSKSSSVLQCLAPGLLLLVLLPCSTHAFAPNWMYLGIVGVGAPLQQHPAVIESNGAGGAREVDDAEVAKAKAVCGVLPGLIAQQIQVCMAHPDTIRSVSDGARKGINECQYQFRNERWNCTTNSNEQSVFGYILERGSKETAFIYAVTSAGVVHAVTQACSSGNLTECTCDERKQSQTTRQGWKWGGCSDNLGYGVQFARKFVDAPEKIEPKEINSKNKKAWIVRMQMNLHNNEAGRQVVVNRMRLQCRCHGVSGSCELKTCWKTMPSFNEIGDILKKKYHQAIQVSRGTVNASNKSNAHKRLQRKSRESRHIGRRDLVHIHKSPNYCIQDPIKGIPGTQGRECNKTSQESDSCDLLCCGRGYNTQVIKHVERCHCKFIWCCYVRCKTCETQIDRHTCK